MWQRFTERARRVVFNAQEEAGRRNEPYVSTEHLLIGLLRETDCRGVQVVQAIGCDPAVVWTQILGRIVARTGPATQQIQLTPRAKRVFDLASHEARQLGIETIGTEHLLLGLVVESEGLAGVVLASCGVDADRARDTIRARPTDPEPAEGYRLPATVYPPAPVQPAVAPPAASQPEPSPAKQATGWGRFTERARQTVFQAQEEARRRGMMQVGPEHLLLALLRDDRSVAARILERMGANRAGACAALEAQIPSRSGNTAAEMELTAESKRAVDRWFEEARLFNHNYIGTEHMLLGLVRDEGLAGRVLANAGIDPERVRAEVRAIVNGGSQPGESG